jgi:hypothetical protein
VGFISDLNQKNEKQIFIAVDPLALKPGMLLDRSLFIYLKLAKRYVKVQNALTPLSQKKYEQLINHSGGIFSDLPDVRERYPDLLVLSLELKRLTENNDSPPYERNRLIRGLLMKVLPYIFKKSDNLNFGYEINDITYAILFIHHTFQYPKFETLEYLENHSVLAFQESLKTAALSAIFALLFGYNDSEYLYRYINVVFTMKAKFFEKEFFNIPNFTELDLRFQNSVIHLNQKNKEQFGVFIDELWDIIIFSHFYLTKNFNFESERISQRIKKELDLLMQAREQNVNEIREQAA